MRTDRSGEIFDNFQITQFLANGGMADVYLARPLSPDERLDTYEDTIAIKISRGKLSDHEVGIFLKEAQIMQSLEETNPHHFVKVFAFGVKHQQGYIAMRYYRYGSLRKMHFRGSILTFRAISDYVSQLKWILEEVHKEGLVHRDLKPENILVEVSNHIDWLHLSDFGIAVGAHRTASLTTQDFAGTAAYIAPEQWQNKARPASDQYALAIMVYEWIVGRTPFVADNLMGYMWKHCNESPPSLLTREDITAAIEAVIIKALSKNPHERYESITAFADALLTAIYEIPQPTPAVPNTLFQRSAFRDIYKPPFLHWHATTSNSLAVFVGGKIWGFNIVTGAPEKRSADTQTKIRDSDNIDEAALQKIYIHLANQFYHRPSSLSLSANKESILIIERNSEIILHVTHECVDFLSLGRHLFWDFRFQYLFTHRPNIDPFSLFWESFYLWIRDFPHLEEKICVERDDRFEWRSALPLAYTSKTKRFARQFSKFIIVCNHLSEIHLFSIGINNHEIEAITWSPDGTLLAIGSEEGDIMIFTYSGNLLRTIRTGLPISNIAWSPDGTMLAVGGWIKLRVYALT